MCAATSDQSSRGDRKMVLRFEKADGESCGKVQGANLKDEAFITGWWFQILY